MDQRHAKLGRDMFGGRGPFRIEVVMHRENPKFIDGEQMMEDEQSRMEILLRMFSIGIDAHFMKQWLQKQPTLATYEVSNLSEDWKTEAMSLNHRVKNSRCQQIYGYCGA